MKKTLALVLAVIMAVSMLTVFAITSSAAAEEIVVEPSPYGDIELWGGRTNFLTTIKAADNATLFAGLKDGSLKVDVIFTKIWDDNPNDDDWFYIKDFQFIADQASKDFYGSEFIRFAASNYGLPIDKDDVFTVSLKIYDAKTGELKYFGTSERGAFDAKSGNKEGEEWAAIYPETIPFAYNSVTPCCGGVENWGGKTYFIVALAMTDDKDETARKAVTEAIKDADSTVKVTVIDETTGKKYVVKDWTPDANGVYGNWFIRFNPCDYQIPVEKDHAYTVAVKVTDKAGKVLFNGTSPKGAFDYFNEAFLKDGAIVPDTPIGGYVETGDTAVIATIVAVVALAAMAVVVKKVRV